MTDTKFKAGDRVRTIVASLAAVSDRTGTIVGATNFNLGWDVLMDAEPRKPTDFAGWYYHDDELELIEETDPRDRALNEIRDIVKCAFGRRYDAIQAIEVQIPNILRETGRL